MDWLEKAPVFENLHNEPRFQQMMAGVEAKIEEMCRRVRELEKEWGLE